MCKSQHETDGTEQGSEELKEARKTGTKMRKRRVSVTLTEPYLKGIQELLDGGTYYDQGELLREALQMLFKYHGMYSLSYT